MLREREQRVLESLLQGQPIQKFLDPEDRSAAFALKTENAIINAFVGVVNPNVLPHVPGEVEFYILFVDPQDLGKTLALKETLAKSPALSRISAYVIGAGEQELVLFLSGSTNELNEILELIKKEIGDEKDKISCLRVQADEAAYFYRQKVVPYSGEDPLDPVILTQIQSDYCSVSLSELESLKKKKVLLGYSIIYDFLLLGKIRLVVPLWTPHSKQVDKILNNILSDDDILKNLIFFLRVRPEKSDVAAGAFADAPYVILAEFDSLTELNEWKTSLLTHCKKLSGMNTSPLLIVGCMNETPLLVSNVHRFERIAQQYSLGHSSIGTIFMGASRKPLVFDTECPYHGLVCGSSRSGKTNTMILLANAFFASGKAVHFLDVKGEFAKHYLRRNLPHEIVNVQQILADGKLDLERVHRPAREIYPLSKLTSRDMASVTGILLESAVHLGPSKQLSHVIIVEEAPTLFTDRNQIATLRNALNLTQGLGCIIWIITQQLNAIQLDNGTRLAELIPNRIIHTVTVDERHAAMISLTSEVTNRADIIYSIEPELVNLPQGTCYLSFVGRDKMRKPPVKAIMNQIIETEVMATEQT